MNECEATTGLPYQYGPSSNRTKVVAFQLPLAAYAFRRIEGGLRQRSSETGGSIKASEMIDRNLI
jgi:hypothetical protein